MALSCPRFSVHSDISLCCRLGGGSTDEMRRKTRRGTGGRGAGGRRLPTVGPTRNRRETNVGRGRNYGARRTCFFFFCNYRSRPHDERDKQNTYAVIAHNSHARILCIGAAARTRPTEWQLKRYLVFLPDEKLYPPVSNRTECGNYKLPIVRRVCREIMRAK